MRTNYLHTYCPNFESRTEDYEIQTSRKKSIDNKPLIAWNKTK